MRKSTLKSALLIPALGLALMAFAPLAGVNAQDNTKKEETKKEEVKKEGIYVEEETHDFGTISRDGDKVTAKFVLHNDTDKPISLVSVVASCGCTTPSYSKEPVAPGKTTEIETVFNPKGQFGPVNKRVTAKTDSGVTLNMYIKCIVE